MKSASDLDKVDNISLLNAEPVCHNLLAAPADKILRVNGLGRHVAL